MSSKYDSYRALPVPYCRPMGLAGPLPIQCVAFVHMECDTKVIDHDGNIRRPTWDEIEGYSKA
jgi:hypothetical protein